MNGNPFESEDHLRALQVVRSILGTTVNPERIVFGNAKSYHPILLDGNSWKTICRLYFHGPKSIGILNTRRVETRTRIDSTDDIKVFASDLKILVEKYG